MAASDIDILRFKRDMDQAIAVANREIIHPLIPKLRVIRFCRWLCRSRDYAVVIFKPHSRSPLKTTVMRLTIKKLTNFADTGKCMRKRVKRSTR